MNRGMRVLQTLALPLGYSAVNLFHENLLPKQNLFREVAVVVNFLTGEMNPPLKFSA